MKELSIKEKAKAYDEAIERANSLLSGNQLGNAWIYKLLPELRKSEDERIRKCITLLVNGLTNEHFVRCGASLDEIKVWLEKQGETFTKKDVDDAYLKGVCDAKHELEKQGEHSSKNIVKAWKDMRLEVYQQASGNRHEHNYSDDTTKMFSLNDIDEIVEKMSEQSPTEWSEEDERNMGGIVANLEYLKDKANAKTLKDAFQEKIDWLKSFKDRVGCEVNCTTTKDWSGEDDVWIERACMLLSELNDLSNLTLAKIPSNVNEIIEHIKTLRPQNHWKPTEEQMKALNKTIHASNFGLDSERKRCLESLYEQLNKL